ncbi:MAG TPA: metallophosphoesterase [Planctomycetota bacterium]|nr:metallophosphoesterase [Planctomycetota bacterium]
MVPSGFLLVLVGALLPLAAFCVIGLRAWGALRRRLPHFRRRPPGPLVTAALWPPLGAAAAAYAAVFTLAAAWAFLVEPGWVAVETSRLETSGPLLDRTSLKVLHVTDLHLEELGGPEERLLDVARRERPDLVLLTGDYVNSREALSVLVRLLRGLSAPLGVFGVEGHHDHKYRIAEAFEQAGATLLRDEFVLLEGGDRPVVVAGLSMHPSRTLADVLRTAPPDAFRIVLHHAPEMARDLRPGQAGLFLCGHTHGGQIRVPGLGPLLPAWRSPSAFGPGESEIDGTRVIVNRGMGMSGGPLPRARLLSRPEIRLIEISAK